MNAQPGTWLANLRGRLVVGLVVGLLLANLFLLVGRALADERGEHRVRPLDLGQLAEVRESVATGVQHGSGGGFVAAREGDLPEHALGHGLLRQRVLSSRVLERPLRGGRGALEVAAEEVGVSEMPVDGGQIPRLAERQHAAAGVYEVAPTADEIARQRS